MSHQNIPTLGEGYAQASRVQAPDAPIVTIVSPVTAFIQVIGDADKLIKITETHPPEVIKVQVPGARGLTGLPGSGVTVDVETNIDLGGHRVVKLSDQYAVYANSYETENVNFVIGITTTATVAGELAKVQTAGFMSELSWSWIPNSPIFCGNSGILTQEFPASGFCQILAIAVTSTKIFITPKSAIVLQG